MTAQTLERSHLEERHHVTGTIVQRRCLGKHLAFADILVDGDDCNGKESVVFRSTSFQGDNFPTKNSALPFGATVDLIVSQATRDGPKWEVLSWRMLENPHEKATQVAREGIDGMSCSKYLASRGKAYLTNTCSSANRDDKKPKKQRNALSTTIHQTNDSYGHGDQKAKALRAKVFALWLVENILQGDGNDVVLDVAGGKGLLSLELAALARVPCTVIDPLIRRKPKSMKKLQKRGAPTPKFVARPFCNNDSSREMVHGCTCLVGLHPDECTEDIVDVALQHNKSFAVVPCCVFPTFFPLRRMSSGEMVNTHVEFLKYLLEKDIRLRQSTLNFQGKNKVIYFKAEK